MRPPVLRPLKLASVPALAAAGLLACAAPALAIAPEDSASPNAGELETAYWVMFAVTALLALAAIAGLLVAYRRFRVRTHRDLREPRRLAAGRGTLAKVAGGLGALALAIFLFGVVVNDRAEDAVAEEAAGEALEIDAIGQQWLWRFEYPVEAEGGASEGIATVFSYNRLVVPVGTPVNLNLDSVDVLHRWHVPALGPQAQAVPGEIHTTSFLAEEEGVYEGRSTQFSGTGYPTMRIWVEAVSPGEYDEYVQGLADDIAAAQSAVAEEVARQAQEGASEAGEGPVSAEEEGG